MATINCDSEALDKFLRSINELPEWIPAPGGNLVALQDEKTLKSWLDTIHLSEYFESLRVFSKCKEWWCKLPLFTDEELRMWIEMDKPGHLIRFRTAMAELQYLPTDNDMLARPRFENVVSGNRKDVALPLELTRIREEEDDILVLFQGSLVTLNITALEIRILKRDGTNHTNLHRHPLQELLYVCQDGEHLTKFGYGLVDGSFWEFQTASIVTTAKVILIIAHRFGF